MPVSVRHPSSRAHEAEVPTCTRASPGTVPGGDRDTGTIRPGHRPPYCWRRPGGERMEQPDERSSTHAPSTSLRSARVVGAVAAGVVGAGCAVAVIGLRSANDRGEPEGQNWWLVAWFVTGLAYSLAGVVLVTRPGRRLLGGWLLVVGASSLTAAVAVQYRGYEQSVAGPPRWPALADADTWARPLGAAVLVALGPGRVGSGGTSIGSARRRDPARGGRRLGRGGGSERRGPAPDRCRRLVDRGPDRVGLDRRARDALVASTPGHERPAGRVALRRCGHCVAGRRPRWPRCDRLVARRA